MPVAVDVEQLLNTIGKKLTTDLKDAVLNKQVTQYGAVNASGKLYDSIRYEVSNSVLTVYGNDYIYYLQYGRKNGKRPPASVIREWIENKPSAQANFNWAALKEYQKKSIAFAIAKKIGEKGTTIFQQGGSTLVSGIFNRTVIDDLRAQFEAGFFTEVANDFKSNVLKAAA